MAVTTDKYQIIIKYETGDSESSSTEQTTLDGNFNLSTAKENLKRIKVHNDFYKLKTNWRRFTSSNEEPQNPPACWVADKHNVCFAIKLLDDSGREYQIWPFWQGYFEDLLGAKIIPVSDEETFFGEEF